MTRALPLILLCAACATVPRGSTVCASSDFDRVTLDPSLSLPMPTCDDIQAAIALAQRISADAGIGWRRPSTLRVHADACWDVIPGVAVTEACGLTVFADLQVDRCLVSLLHEDYHWLEDRPNPEHVGWDATGYWPVEEFFEYVLSTSLLLPQTTHAKSCLWAWWGRTQHMVLPPAIEAKLRARGWAAKLDAWFASMGKPEIP